MWTVRIIVCLSLIVLIPSCSKDACEDTVCLNGGACQDGSCICPSGYSGVNCENRTGYDCSGGSCIYVEGNPSYATYELCESACSSNSTGGGCDDSCTFANDGECDDFILCSGTDCSDCGGELGGGFNCIGGNCVNVSSNGEYYSYVVCQSNCSNSGGNTSGYNCSNGNCNYVSTNAQYGSLSACESNCGGTSNTSGYNCSGGNCNYVSSNAQYGSLSACENNCGNTSGYNCGSNGCYSVSSNAEYGSLASCENNCGPDEGRVAVWNSNDTPCPAGAGSTISVYIDNVYVGGLNSYFTSGPPSCGANGTVTKTLEVGSHTLYADCGSYSWGPRTINLSKDECLRWELE